LTKIGIELLVNLDFRKITPWNTMVEDKITLKIITHARKDKMMGMFRQEV